MSKIIQFFSTIIDAIVSVVEFVTQSVTFLYEIVASLPLMIIAPVSAAIAVLVLYAIIGRGK